MTIGGMRDLAGMDYATLEYIIADQKRRREEIEKLKQAKEELTSTTEEPEKVKVLVK